MSNAMMAEVNDRSGAIGVSVSEETATIVNIQRFSTEDGPGIRTTVFFKGCPMQCLWCQNPETITFAPHVVWNGGRCLGDRGCIQRCSQKALALDEHGMTIAREHCRGCGTCVEFCPSEALEIQGKRATVTELFERVRRDIAFYETSGGGVTLSGGEPLAQPRGAIGLLRRLKQAGIHTALDTCGAVAEGALAEALEYTDLVLFDVKTVDPEKHERFTGVPFERVSASARVVAHSPATIWVRTPVIPGYTDDDAGIRAVARFVRSTFPRCARHDLLAFSNLCRAKYQQLGKPFAFADTPLLPAAQMERLCAAAREETDVPTFWSGPTKLENAG